MSNAEVIDAGATSNYRFGDHWIFDDDNRVWYNSDEGTFHRTLAGDALTADDLRHTDLGDDNGRISIDPTGPVGEKLKLFRDENTGQVLYAGADRIQIDLESGVVSTGDYIVGFDPTRAELVAVDFEGDGYRVEYYDAKNDALYHEYDASRQVPVERAQVYAGLDDYLNRLDDSGRYAFLAERGLIDPSTGQVFDELPDGTDFADLTIDVRTGSIYAVDSQTVTSAADRSALETVRVDPGRVYDPAAKVWFDPEHGTFHNSAAGPALTDADLPSGILIDATGPVGRHLGEGLFTRADGSAPEGNLVVDIASGEVHLGDINGAVVGYNAADSDYVLVAGRGTYNTRTEQWHNVEGEPVEEFEPVQSLESYRQELIAIAGGPDATPELLAELNRINHLTLDESGRPRGYLPDGTDLSIDLRSGQVYAGSPQDLERGNDGQPVDLDSLRFTPLDGSDTSQSARFLFDDHARVWLNTETGEFHQYIGGPALTGEDLANGLELDANGQIAARLRDLAPQDGSGFGSERIVFDLETGLVHQGSLAGQVVGYDENVVSHVAGAGFFDERTGSWRDVDGSELPDADSVISLDRYLEINPGDRARIIEELGLTDPTTGADLTELADGTPIDELSVDLRTLSVHTVDSQRWSRQVVETDNGPQVQWIDRSTNNVYDKPANNTVNSELLGHLNDAGELEPGAADQGADTTDAGQSPVDQSATDAEPGDAEPAADAAPTDNQPAADAAPTADGTVADATPGDSQPAADATPVGPEDQPADTAPTADGTVADDGSAYYDDGAPVGGDSRYFADGQYYRADDGTAVPRSDGYWADGSRFFADGDIADGPSSDGGYFLDGLQYTADGQPADLADGAADSATTAEGMSQFSDDGSAYFDDGAPVGGGSRYFDDGQTYRADDGTAVPRSDGYFADGPAADGGYFLDGLQYSADGQPADLVPAAAAAAAPAFGQGNTPTETAPTDTPIENLPDTPPVDLTPTEPEAPAFGQGTTPAETAPTDTPFENLPDTPPVDLTPTEPEAPAFGQGTTPAETEPEPAAPADPTFGSGAVEPAPAPDFETVTEEVAFLEPVLDDPSPLLPEPDVQIEDIPDPVFDPPEVIDDELPIPEPELDDIDIDG